MEEENDNAGSSDKDGNISNNSRVVGDLLELVWPGVWGVPLHGSRGPSPLQGGGAESPRKFQEIEEIYSLEKAWIHNSNSF